MTCVLPDRLGLCLACNYSLHGLPMPRCPECGREFDPADPATMNMGRELTPAMKWLLGPLRWPISAVTVCSLLFALWAARLPGGLVRNSMSLWILVAIGMLWLVWPVVRLIVGKRCGWPQSLLMRGQRQRVLVGVVVLAAAGAVWRNAPLKSALMVSRPSMDRMARKLLASGKFYADDQWVG